MAFSGSSMSSERQLLPLLRRTGDLCDRARVDCSTGSHCEGRVCLHDCRITRRLSVHPILSIRSLLIRGLALRGKVPCKWTLRWNESVAAM